MRAKSQRQKVLDHMNEFGSITRVDAERLGIGKTSFWSVICALKREGMYITIHRNRFNPELTEYVLGTEEDRKRDSVKPHYSCTNNQRLWCIWRHMRERCNSPHHKSYATYGGRGIKVCEEWERSFEAFAEWAYANGYDDNAKFMECTIDRIDSNGNYEPSNCRWATIKEQNNNRRTNRLITYNGETKTVCGWSEELNIPRDTLRFRLTHGWGVEKAFNTPVKRQRNNRKAIWIAE